MPPQTEASSTFWLLRCQEAERKDKAELLCPLSSDFGNLQATATVNCETCYVENEFNAELVNYIPFKVSDRFFKSVNSVYVVALVLVVAIDCCEVP